MNMFSIRNNRLRILILVHALYDRSLVNATFLYCYLFFCCDVLLKQVSAQRRGIGGSNDLNY